MNLKDILKEDFNLDLPISGGLGNTVEDSIVIQTADPDTASVVAMGIAAAIFPSAGVYWQCIGMEPVQESPDVFKYIYGTLQLTEAEVVQSARELYFNLGALGIGALQVQAIPNYSLGENIPVVLPAQLGFAHLLEVQANNAESEPDDQTLIYDFPEGGLSIRVKQGTAETDPEELLDREFAEAKIAAASKANTFNAINTQRVQGHRYLAYELDGVSEMLFICSSKGYVISATVSIKVQEKALFDAAIECLGLLHKAIK